MWIEWYENGAKKYEGNYKNGKLDGVAEGWFENGDKNYKEYYESGKLIKDFYY